MKQPRAYDGFARRPGCFAGIALLFTWIVAPASEAQKPAHDGPPPAIVRVGEVKLQSVQQHRLVLGTIQAIRRSTVAAEEPGRVTYAPPDRGTSVQTGDVLARLNDALARIARDAAGARVKGSTALVAEREADLALARRKRTRTQSLVERGATAPNELDDARDQETAAAARLEQARAELLGSRSNLADQEQRLAMMTVKAPFDGVVVDKMTEVGQWLGPGDAVAQILEIHRVDAVLDVPQALVGHVKSGAATTVRIEALGTTFEGVVHRIVPNADTTSRTFPVLVRIENARLQLKPGMMASAELPTGRLVEALTVPRDAIVSTSSDVQVFVRRGGVAAAVSVQARFGRGDRFVVEGVLHAGDQVVIEGNERLFPGQPLKLAGTGEARP